MDGDFIVVNFREYDQARRAYLFALKCDANNEQTMRELI